MSCSQIPATCIKYGKFLGLWEGKPLVETRAAPDVGRRGARGLLMRTVLKLYPTQQSQKEKHGETIAVLTEQCRKKYNKNASQGD